MRTVTLDKIKEILGWQVNSSAILNDLRGFQLKIINENFDDRLRNFFKKYPMHVEYVESAIEAIKNAGLWEKFLLHPRISEETIFNTKEFTEYGFLDAIKTLSSEILIEFEGEGWRRQTSDFTFEKFVRDLNKKDRPLVTEKITQAKKNLKNISPLSFELVSHLTHVISCYRENPERNPGSSSQGTLMGLTILKNPHSNLFTSARLGDALVHESIHFILCLYELQARLVFTEKFKEMPFAVSPWTSQRITAHSLIHACFVWYGLWHYWRRVYSAALSAQDKVEATYYISLSSFGFRSGQSPLAQFNAVKEGIHPDVFRIIEEICGEVREFHDLGEWGNTHVFR